MKIVADPNIPFVRDAFRDIGDVELVSGRNINREMVRNARMLLVRSVTPVHAGLLDGSMVRFVASATIGTDHVDVPWLKWRGIGFAHAPGSNANSVAEYVVASLLVLARSRSFRLQDKTLGVIGVGNVGSKVVKYARALGMRVLQNDPPRQRAESPGAEGFVSLQQVLAESDIVTLHVPLTRDCENATFHLFDPLTLGRPLMVINSSRGAVLDNARLLEAIRQGNVTGCVLDVWEGEPYISRELLEVVNIGTPHIAGYSFDGKVNGVRMIHEAARLFFGVSSPWKPVLPEPPVPVVNLTVTGGESDEDVLWRAIRAVYNILDDDAAMRRSPEEFDRLRAMYPVRREWMNTAVKMTGGSDALRRKVSSLGFQLE